LTLKVGETDSDTCVKRRLTERFNKAHRPTVVFGAVALQTQPPQAKTLSE